MDSAEALAPFDDDLFDAVSDRTSVAVGELRSLAARHQAAMADLPGVENLLYEWRKQHGATELGRTDAAYFAAVPETVWTEFAAALDASDEQRGALVALHEEQTRTTLDVDAAADGVAYVVLARE